MSALLLATRLAGAHLYLCFDGAEPPVTLHSIDGGEHDCPGDTEQRDSEVDLSGFALAKAKSSFGGENLIAPMMWSLPAATPKSQTSDVLQLPPDPTIPDYLRPPTRGPPGSLPA